MYKIKYQDIIEKFKILGGNINEELVDKALEIAIRVHKKQLRASSLPYYFHPIEVAEIIAQMNLDSKSIIAAILHDTVEDTELSLLEIESYFGIEVANLVDGVTKLTKIKFISDDIKQAENFRKLLLSMSNDIRILLIKLADRLHNMRTIDFVSSQDKRYKKAAETMEIYAPLAERLGLHKFKKELQDICFRILSPGERDMIQSKILFFNQNNNSLIKKTLSQLKSLLITDDIKEIWIFGRTKTPYSIWNKMQRKNLELEQLSDILAFRIIVNSPLDCYKALGKIHLSYKMVYNKFRDFISTPKENGYRGLHTVIIGPYFHKIEIQIRDKEMDQIAESGVAAHWIYKQNQVVNLSTKEKYSWLQELLSILKSNRNPKEFFQNTKLSMYYDQIFCFTTKGEVISLPKGATIVDFAYRLSIKIGNSCIGAKVNGNNTPLKTVLQTADVVEIFTSSSHYISTSCLSFVVTGTAKNAIKNIYRLQERERTVSIGKGILISKLHELKSPNISLLLTIVEKNYKGKIENLYYSIATKKISVEYVVNNLLYETLNSIFPVYIHKRKTPDYNSDCDFLISNKRNSTNGLRCCFVANHNRTVIAGISGIYDANVLEEFHDKYCLKMKNFFHIFSYKFLEKKSKINYLMKLDIGAQNDSSVLDFITQLVINEKSYILNINITDITLNNLIYMQISVISYSKENAMNVFFRACSNKKLEVNLVKW